MNVRSPLLGISLVVTAVVASAGSASVVFIDSERYTDAAHSHSFVASERDRAEVRLDIERHLQQLAERSLPVGDVLTVEVLDIDLAGYFQTSRLRNGYDVRIVRDIASPRLKLRYTLMHDDQMLDSAEEQLTDLGFLTRTNRYPVDDRLRYEKAMLDDWFHKRFGIR